MGTTALTTTIRVDPAQIQTDADLDRTISEIADVWHAKLSPGDQLGLLECLYAVFAGLRFQEAGSAPDAKFVTAATACGAGCSWCCHMNVECLPAELDLIVSVLPKLPAVVQARARSEINRLARIGYSNEDRVRKKEPCPFLHPTDKTCTIYQFRPYACRVHHSTRVSACRSDFYNCRSDVLARYQVDEIANGRGLLLRAAWQVLERWQCQHEFEEMTIGLAARLNRTTESV